MVKNCSHSAICQQRLMPPDAVVAMLPCGFEPNRRTGSKSGRVQRNRGRPGPHQQLHQVPRYDRTLANPRRCCRDAGWPEKENQGGIFLRYLRLILSPCLDASQGWSLRRIARLCGCNAATSTCLCTASCPLSPSWACSWQGPSSSSTSRTAITGRLKRGSNFGLGLFGTFFYLEYSGLFLGLSRCPVHT